MDKRFSFGQRWTYGWIQFVEHFLGKDRAQAIVGKTRSRFYRKAHIKLKEQGPGQILPLERRTDLTYKEFMRDYVRKGRPVIMEGAAKDWACVKNWSIDYFKENFGDDDINMLDQSTQEMALERMKLRDVLENIQSEGSKYLRFYPFLFKHPERLADFDYEWLRARRKRGTIAEAFQVFIASKGKYTPMHNASQGNLFIQAYGEKSWVLYSNHYTPIVDPRPARNMYRNAPFKKPEGPFNPHNPDFETPYTLFQYADGYEFTLKPGDVFWNPPYYWHTVQNPSNSIGISYKWIAPAYNWWKSPLYYFLEMCATKPNIFKSIKLFKQEFNLVNLAETGRLKKFEKEIKTKETAKA